MTTKVYGQSDDLIEIEGDVDGEVDHHNIERNAAGALLVCSDGTVLIAKYGKAERGIWSIEALKNGNLLNEITVCVDEEASPHSDVVEFCDGLSYIIVAKTWTRVS